MAGCGLTRILFRCTGSCPHSIDGIGSGGSGDGEPEVGNPFAESIFRSEETQDQDSGLIEVEKEPRVNKGVVAFQQVQADGFIGLTHAMPWIDLHARIPSGIRTQDFESGLAEAAEVVEVVADASKDGLLEPGGLGEPCGEGVDSERVRG